MLKSNSKKISVKKLICYAAIGSCIGVSGFNFCFKQGESQPVVIEKENVENIDNEKQENISFADNENTKKYPLYGYYDGENIEYVFQNKEEYNQNCQGLHKYYDRYLVEEQKFENVGFTCDGNLQYHNDNDNVIERDQVFHVSKEISEEKLKHGELMTTVFNDALNIECEKQLQQSNFAIADQNNRALCVVEMKPVSEGETIYFVGYIHQERFDSITFYDVLRMENRTFSFDEYYADYISLLTWGLDDYQVDSTVSYQELTEIEDYIRTNQSLYSLGPNKVLGL